MPPIDIIPFPDSIPYHRQGVPVPGSKKPGSTAAYREGIWGTQYFPNGAIKGELLTDLFEAGLSRGASRPFLGVRPVLPDGSLSKDFSWISWGETDRRRRLIGSAVHYLYQTKAYVKAEYDSVGIWCGNRPEWQLVDLACQAYRKVSVALYDTLGPDVVEYIINHADIPIVFAAGNKLPALLTLAPKVPNLKTIISIDKLNPQTKAVLTAWGNERGIEIYDLDEFEKLGAENEVAPIPAQPDTVATICYTSGTTNVPKGVVLTHKNLATSALADLHGLNWQDGAAVLSYLPLAHIYERVIELIIIALGGRVGFFSGDPLKLLEDAQILKPFVFPSVPRVLNRIYQAAMQAGKAPGLKGALFRKACDVKLAEMRVTGITTHRLWDALVFRKVQAVLGGNVGVLTSGSAPISKDCMDFLKIAFATTVVEGYGLTETCATTTIGLPGDPASTGTIGAPRVVNEIKLLDVPSMNYTSEDKPHPRGELLVRGANVFVKYHKDEKNTKEALDDEGWFHTGDVASVDACGRFTIIDRIKNIMKLAQGEYVALEKVENVYTACPVVAQIYVHGDSLQDHLVAIVVPDPVVLSSLVKELGKSLDPTDVAAVKELIQDATVRDVILKTMGKTAKRAGLNGFEQCKKIHVTMDQFSIENGLLTPTFKVRRKDAANAYKAQIDAMYGLGS